jgi:hypothetical protein
MDFRKWGDKMTEKEKKHLTLELCVDFVNQRLSSEQTRMMQKHLGEGCGKCSKVLEVWTRVRRAANRESKFEAPESVVRHVRNAFALTTEQKTSRRRFEIPRLVFDSLWQPAAVGVRSASSAPRQVLYSAGAIAIEMRLEQSLNPELVNITGQISDAALKGDGLAGISVLVNSSERKIAEARTNEFGEFQLSFVPETGLRIFFAVENKKDLSIPLDGSGVMILHGK